MIDMSEERLLTLSRASRHVPGRQGRHPHASTVWRWALRGIRGVRLETLIVGGCRMTSLEALQRFAERVTAVADGTSAPVVTSKGRARSLARAERELDAAGI